MKIVKTPMLKRYLIKFVIRIVIFGVVFFTYLMHKEMLEELMHYNFTLGITPLHVLWGIFMLMMLLHIFPHKRLTMALMKRKEENYIETSEYSRLELLEYVQDQNMKAWRVMFVWLGFNAIWGILYLFEILDSTDLLMLTVFYFLCDYICILFFCPFQSHLMKNKCCINCRIYDWGHFMMFTPMLFIKNFFSWSLFFVSLIVLLHWEITYAKHPERFWSGSNQTLQCGTCKDKTCQLKRCITKKTQ